MSSGVIAPGAKAPRARAAGVRIRSLLRRVLRLVDDPRHYKDEDAQIRHRKDDFLVARKEATVGPQLGEHLVAVEEPQRAQAAQEGATFSGHRREEGNNHYDVHQCRRMEKVLEPVFAYDGPCGNVGEEHKPDGNIDEFDRLRSRQEGGHHDEQNRDDIEGKEPVAEAICCRGTPLIELAQPRPPG